MSKFLIEKIGEITTKSSREIKSSKISIGFECLDRKLWEDTDDIYEFIGQLGVKWARVQSGWNRTEVEKGCYDWKWFDRIIDMLLEQGIEPWVCLCYGNKHYTGEPDDEVHWQAPVHSEEMRQGWSNYVTALVKRYTGRVKYYEVWNEPTSFWDRRTNQAEDYLKLVDISSQAVRATDPQAKMIGGVMCSSPFVMNIDYYLKVFKGGLADMIDILSFHAYSVCPEEAYGQQQLDTFKYLCDNNGGQHLKIWQGEGGCPSEQGAPGEAMHDIPFNEERQSKHALRRLVYDLAHGNELTSYFQISDFKAKGPNKELVNHYGLIDLEVKPKPSYFAMKNLCTLFDGETELGQFIFTGIHQDNIWNDGLKRTEFNEKIGKNVYTFSFKRKGYPFIAYWYASNLISEACGQKDFCSVPIEIRLWNNEQIALKTPVIIDTISGEVFRANDLEPEDGSFSMLGQMLRQIPLKDYPLIITDLQAVKDLIK